MGKADDLTKHYIQQNDRFADICNFYLFNGKQVIRSEDLQEQDTTELEVILGDGRSASVQKLRDVLKKTILKKADDVMYMIVGIENQHDIHYAMAVKNMVYDALNYAGQVERIASQHKKAKDLKNAEFLSGFSKTDKLIPVVTITIYWNSGGWDGPRSLHEMFDVKNRRILDYISDYRLNLIVPDEIEDFDKFETELGNVMNFISCSDDKDELRAFYNSSSDTRISKEAANLLNVCFDARIEIVNKEGDDVFMCKGLEDLIEECKAEAIATGKAEGKEVGRAEGRAEALASLVIDGLLSKEVAAKRAGMSIESFDEFLLTVQD